MMVYGDLDLGLLLRVHSTRVNKTDVPIDDWHVTRLSEQQTTGTASIPRECVPASFNCLLWFL